MMCVPQQTLMGSCDFASSQAYFKMQNVLVDDRRIWVDLCVIFLCS